MPYPSGSTYPSSSSFPGSTFVDPPSSSSMTGITLEKAQAIEAASVTGATIDELGQLKLSTVGTTIFNLGKVTDDEYTFAEATVNVKAFDTDLERVVVPAWNDGSTPNSHLTTISGTISDVAVCTAWSPNGRYAAFGYGSSIAIFKRGQDTFTKVTDPATMPTGTVLGIAWSSDGLYLAVAHLSTPFVSIYKRSGDTFTKLTDPGTLPAVAGNAIAWSPSTRYLAVGHTTGTPRITLYRRDGDVFTKLSNPASQPAGSIQSLAWSPSGKHLVVGTFAGPGSAFIYKQSGDTFTAMSTPFTTDANAGALAWTPTGQYLFVGHSTTGHQVIKRSGDTFTDVTSIDIAPGNGPLGAAWSPDNNYLAVCGGSAPYLTFYKRFGDALVKTVTPATVSASVHNDVAWSPDGRFVAVGISASPYFMIYKSANGTDITKSVPVQLVL